MARQKILDRKSLLRQQDRLTRPPRLEGKIKNAMMNPVRKKSKFRVQQLTNESE